MIKNLTNSWFVQSGDVQRRSVGFMASGQPKTCHELTLTRLDSSLT